MWGSGVAAVYGVAAGGVAGIHLSVPGDHAGALGLPASGGRGTLLRLCFVHEEVLSSARGVPGFVEEGLGRDRVGTFGVGFGARGLIPRRAGSHFARQRG